MTKITRGALIASISTAALLGVHSLPAKAQGSPTPPSAVGNEMVQWIALSPAYTRTGLVVAQTAQLSCSANCLHLWVSKDGGASWHRAAAQNWTPGRVWIGVSAGGHESLYTPGTRGLERSDDDGETWLNSAAPGIPTILPSYPQDEGLAVASAAGGGASGDGDYLSRGGKTERVQGSGGAVVDLSFMTSPDFPSGGTFNPALMVGTDPHTEQPFVLQCSAQLACSTKTPLPWPSDKAGVLAVQTALYPSADYTQRGSVFAATPFGIDKSLDGGQTFVPLPVVPTAGATTTTTPMMALAPGYREAGPVRTLYVAVFQAFMSQTSGHVAGGLYRSSDGGTTWSALVTNGPFAGGAQAVAVAPDGRLFAGYFDGNGHGGLLCSIDGTSWHASCPAIHKSGGVANSQGGATNAGQSSGGSAGIVGGSSGSSAGSGSGGTSGGSQGILPGVANTGSLVSGSNGRSWPWIVLAVAAVLALGGGVSAILGKGALGRRTRSRIRP